MPKLDPPPTPGELLEAFNRAHAAGRQTGAAEGQIVCPRCSGAAVYTFYGHFACTVICPCGFRMRQGL